MLDPTPFFRPLAHRRGRKLAATGAAEAQRRVLRHLLARAAGTRFGRAHGFGAIRDPADFARAVPLRDWQAFWDEWWRDDFPVLSDATWPGRIPFFAETSGTTSGITKHIPVSRAMLRANRRAALDMVLNHLRRRPASGFFGGQGLILGGTTALTELAPGVRSGDLSGIVASTMPLWTRGRTLPSTATALATDWDDKLARIVEEALGRDVRSISGTASWLLVLFERLLAADRARGGHAASLAELFPRLELVIHGGVGFGPYRARFAALLGDGPRPQEVYAASEGFIAYADGPPEDPGLRVLADNGIFFEFVPQEELGRDAPTRHWAADVETGLDYAIVLSTNAGLFAYVLGDLVRVVSREPLRLVVTGRTAHFLSAFGEHVSGGELDRAVAAAAAATGLAVAEYTVAVIPPDASDARGGHLFVVETATPPTPETEAAFAAAVDRHLAAGNADYAAHRGGDAGMRPPTLRLLPEGRFAAWMRRRGKLGGQNKIPRVIGDAAMLADLLDDRPGTDREDP